MSCVFVYVVAGAERHESKHSLGAHRRQDNAISAGFS